MGRSFLDPKYQRSYSGLLLLWKGIGHLIAAMPRYRYILGPVSISNRFSPLSRRLIQRFLDHNYPSPLAGLAAPRRPPQWPRQAQRHPEEWLRQVADLDELSEMIGDIEPSGWGLPILIKQYTKLAAKAVGWNVDPPSATRWTASWPPIFWKPTPSTWPATWAPRRPKPISGCTTKDVSPCPAAPSP